MSQNAPCQGTSIVSFYYIIVMEQRVAIKKPAHNTVRIIGGAWRGRKIHFVDSLGLRPSKDFVRETLFNWLSPSIAGSRCLDLFAGSGALGLEAASRGAAKVIMVEKAPEVVRCLKDQAQMLQADHLDIYPQNAMEFLESAVQPFDIVFLDPPFESDVLPTVIRLLDKKSLLNKGALIYVESPKGYLNPELPQNWHLHREKHAGQVTYRLFKVMRVS